MQHKCREKEVPIPAAVRLVFGYKPPDTSTEYQHRRAAHRIPAPPLYGAQDTSTAVPAPLCGTPLRRLVGQPKRPDTAIQRGVLRSAGGQDTITAVRPATSGSDQRTLDTGNTCAKGVGSVVERTSARAGDEASTGPTFLPELELRLAGGAGTAPTIGPPEVKWSNRPAMSTSSGAPDECDVSTEERPQHHHLSDYILGTTVHSSSSTGLFSANGPWLMTESSNPHAYDSGYILSRPASSRSLTRALASRQAAKHRMGSPRHTRICNAHGVRDHGGGTCNTASRNIDHLGFLQGSGQQHSQLAVVCTNVWGSRQRALEGARSEVGLYLTAPSSKTSSAAKTSKASSLRPARWEWVVPEVEAGGIVESRKPVTRHPNELLVRNVGRTWCVEHGSGKIQPSMPDEQSHSSIKQALQRTATTDKNERRHFVCLARAKPLQGTLSRCGQRLPGTKMAETAHPKRLSTRREL
jgi:hypothetical protein